MRDDGDDVAADILILVLATLIFVACAWAAAEAWIDYKDRLEPEPIPTLTYREP